MTSANYPAIGVTLFVDGHWRPIEPDLKGKESRFPNSRVYRPWRQTPFSPDRYLLDVYIQRDRHCITPTDIPSPSPCPVDHWELPCTTLRPDQVIALRSWLQITSIDAKRSRVQK